MGCTTTQKQRQQLQATRPPTPGTLHLTATTATLTHQASLFKMDPYLTLKLSNQSFTTKVAVNGGKRPVWNEEFVFVVNACYVQGRSLEVRVMDRGVVGDGLVGFGMVDMDGVVGKGGRQEVRCMLSYQYKQAGFVNLIAQFTQQPSQTIHLRFEQAIIRRQTSTIGSQHCWIQATLGEQTLKTHKHKCTKKKPLSWQTEVLTFKVIPSIEKLLVQVMDDNVEIGRLEMEVKDLLAVEEDVFVRDIVYGKGIYAGTVRFRTVKGRAPSFSNPRVEEKYLTVTDQQKVESDQKAYFSQKNVQLNYTQNPNPYVKE